MKTRKALLTSCGVLLPILGWLAGCASSDSGGSSQVSGNMYYGVGLYDPWYYDGGYYPPDVIVTPPPPSRPEAPPRPTHPIAKPPPSSAPRPTPMPSIPSAPRPSLRR
jgi:hypothetical protein